MYRFILFYFVLYICIYVAPWSCEARHLVPLYVHTCSGMTIKLNLTWLDLKLHDHICVLRNKHPYIFVAAECLLWDTKPLPQVQTDSFTRWAISRCAWWCIQRQTKPYQESNDTTIRTQLVAPVNIQLEELWAWLMSFVFSTLTDFHFIF